MKRALQYPLLAACLWATPIHAQCMPSPDTLSAATQTLSSDRLGGRAPSSPHEPLVLDYVAQAFQTAGLTPMGDMANGKREWTQRVSLTRSEISSPLDIALTFSGNRLPLQQGEEIAVRAAAPGINMVDVKAAPIVFIGYGISAPEKGWDDFKGIDLRGKIALILVNDPDYDQEGGPFGGKAMTYYGRWTYKLEEATRQGALGALIIHDEKAASYGWPIVRNSNMAPLFAIPAGPDKHQLQVSGWIQHGIAAQLVATAGLDLQDLERAATRPDFQPAELANVSIDVRYATSHKETVSHNMLGMIRGQKHPDEYLVLSAHWDHIGERQFPDGSKQIYNGATDNAVGLAALLELAKCFGALETPDRSILFLATTAEEQGMLGSRYFVNSPTVPQSAMLGLINFDTMNTSGRSRNVSSFGHAANSLTDSLREAALRQGRYFSPDPSPEAGHFYRSETLPFALAGIPAITFGSGDDLIEGGQQAGRQKMAAYIKNRYHQPTDDWTEDMNFDGVAEDVSLVYDMGRALANGEGRPGWYPGSEFGHSRKNNRR